MVDLAPKGLEGVYVDTTEIATTDKTGNLVYRGYRVIDLAEKTSFENIAYLVVYGSMPDAEKSRGFSRFLRENAQVSEESRKIAEVLRGRPVIDVLRTVVSSLKSEGMNTDALLSIAAKFPEIIHSAANRSPAGSKLPEAYPDRFYYLLTGKEDRNKSRLLEKILIMYMEHEFNASTFALRVTASTMADPVCAFTTALATLKGPLHGGANSAVLKFLLDIKNRDEVKKYVDSALEKKEKIMGFGHRVYKDKDPRAQYIKKILLENFRDNPAVQNAVYMEEYIWSRKALAANVDFYGALYMYLLGIEEKFYLPIFAAARSFGWVAHYSEQISNNKLIRPLAHYVGKTDLTLH